MLIRRIGTICVIRLSTAILLGLLMIFAGSMDSTANSGTSKATSRDFDRGSGMKWIIFALFIGASLASLAWFESAERKYTAGQKSAFGVLAIAAWVLVLVLGGAAL
jgi:hypothetical protein